MKKKILLFSYFCEYNGVEKAILNFLKNLDKDVFDIDLLILGDNEILINEVPDFVNIIRLPLSEYMRDAVVLHPRAMIDKLKSQKKYLSIVKYAVSTAWYGLLYGFNRHAVCKMATVRYKPTVKYDLAIDFYGHNLFGTYFIAKKINADKKATWLHNTPFIEEKLKEFRKIYNAYDKVYGVSSECCNLFSTVFPELKNKVEIFRNINDPEEIQQKGKEAINCKKDCTFISTSGRLNYQKGYDIAIKAAELLKSKGYKFKWFFIGAGGEKTNLEQSVRNRGLQNEIVFTDFCANPYKYISKCDIYVQPSRWEGYCLTLLEARILKIPPIISDIPVFKEQITDGKNGLVFKTDDAADLCNKIEQLLNNEDLAQHIRNNETEDLSFKDEMAKIYSLLNVTK